MKITKLKDGKFKVESHEKGRFYTVNIEQPFCSCPNFIFRMVKTHGECKHIITVKEKYGSSTSESPEKPVLDKKDAKIIEYVAKKAAVDSIELIEKFGEEKINELIEKGELIEDKGRIKILD